MIKFFYTISVTIVFLFFSSGMKGQSKSDSIFQTIEQLGKEYFYRSMDTNYIKSYDHKLNIHLLASNKFNFFQIRDKGTSSQLFYRPETGLIFGAGITHKWFSLDISFSSGIKENTALTSSDFLDFQGRVFGRKQFIEATLQYYYGYNLSSISSYYEETSEDFKARDDMRSIHINLQYLFVFNFTKFSIKAPYVYSQAQRKSAGSPVAGAAFTMYVFDADSSIVPESIGMNFDEDLHLRDLNNIGITLNFGYMHSFVVFKRLYYNIGLIPGLDLNKGDFLTTERHKMDPNLSFRVKVMNSFGYNGPKFYMGAQFIGNVFSARLSKNSQANIGYTKISVVSGYRFGRRK